MRILGALLLAAVAWHEGSLIDTHTRDSSGAVAIALTVDASDVDMLAVAGQLINGIRALEFTVGTPAN